MPTTARRAAFVPLALSYFLRQDFPSAELLVVDDSPKDEISGLLPDDPRIRYISCAEGHNSLGRKRNFACEQARGSVIMHWDDDDWYAPDWVSRQYGLLDSSGCDLCGLRDLHFFQPAKDKAWKYIYSGVVNPWVAGATMAYRKSYWEQHPFKSFQVGEDNAFVWQAAQERVAIQSYTEGFVSLLHDRNTSPKFTEDPQWHKQPVSVIHKLLADDYRSYVTLAATRNPSSGE